MRIALLLICASALAAQTEGEPPAALVEVAIERQEVYVGEWVPITLRIGLEEGVYEERGVALFRRHHELGVQVRATFLRTLPPSLVWSARVAPPVSTLPSLTLVLEDQAAEVTEGPTEERDGRRYRVYSLVRAVIPTAEGEVELAAPSLRGAWATRFRADLLGGRVPLDRREFGALGTTKSLKVKALPPPPPRSPSPPIVGQYQLSARVESAELRVGDTLQWHLEFRGRGAFEALQAPAFPELEAWHRLGVTELRSNDSVVFRYDFLVEADATPEFPGVVIPVFDPTPPAGYRELRTAPIPLAIAGLPKPASMVGDAVVAEASSSEIWPTELGSSSRRVRAGIPRSWRIALAVLPWFFAGIVMWWQHERWREKSWPGVGRGRRARRRFAADARVRGFAPAWITFLAHRLRITESAVVDPHFRSRLVATGLSTAEAEEADRWVREATAARFGGPSWQPSAERVAALVTAIDQQVARSDP